MSFPKVVIKYEIPPPVPFVPPTSGTGEAFPSLFSPGMIIDYAGAAPAPSGWLICDGNSYPTASYPALFAVLQYTYGGSGVNFNVPDLPGRTGTGLNTMPPFAVLNKIIKT